MAGLQELKKRLVSVQTAGKLAAAMKTVSTAKFSRASKLYSGFSAYAETCRRMASRFSSDFNDLYRCKNSEAPPCYLIFAAEQGLCGSYNTELFSFLESMPAEEPVRYLTCGKTAGTFFGDKNKEIYRIYTPGEVPEYDECCRICGDVCRMYANGEISSFSIVYMKMVNSMVQTPDCRKVLPFEPYGESGENNFVQPLFVPDRRTVLDEIGVKVLNSIVYSTLLESAVSLQASTLISMRSACDNADETARNLEIAIHQKRQGAITASVIETSSDILQKEDD